MHGQTCGGCGSAASAPLGEVADKLEALPEISMPELVAARESFQSTLVDDSALLERGICSSHQVSPPQF
nr:hypothetical protein Iba_chr04aCG21920 [Ipomoea batatas]GME21744.1 hypothetical protein Iba_scaffold29042CG0010 [Ipomoea batatas]